MLLRPKTPKEIRDGRYRRAFEIQQQRLPGVPSNECIEEEVHGVVVFAPDRGGAEHIDDPSMAFQEKPGGQKLAPKIGGAPDPAQVAGDGLLHYPFKTTVHPRRTFHLFA